MGSESDDDEEKKSRRKSRVRRNHHDSVSERFAFFRLPTKVEVGYAVKRAGGSKREKEKLKMGKKE